MLRLWMNNPDKSVTYVKLEAQSDSEVIAVG